MNSRKLISLLLCLILTLSCMLPLTACKKDKDDDDGKSPGGSIVGGSDGNTEYTVKVQTVGGMPLEDITVFVHQGDGYSICTMPADTDANGIAKFTLKTSNNYSVELSGVPDGYNVKSGKTRAERYELTSADTVITLSSSPVKDGGFQDVYELGDIMYDFTLTDIDGNVHTLSEMLKTKDMVMLNFWYRDCSNCVKEFPYINSVYQSYSDDIEILAINDYPADNDATVEAYPDFIDQDLKMPLIKVGEVESILGEIEEYNKDPETGEYLTLSRFQSQGYPTTVIIDRYGVVCMIEVGAVLGESKWMNIFNHFVGDDYKQTLITDNSILNPMIEPTIKWESDSADKIADAFNSGNIKVTYSPETNDKNAKYSWPFIVDEYNGEKVVRPSNNGIDNSFSILYADVELKPGEAIMFDWLASTQRNENGTDVLYVLVDGKDIYSISGISEDGYEVCCTYVDPRPVTEGNKNDVATYEVAFVYYKDTVDSEGDDTVYLKNLRVVDAKTIPVETYIFRYAATDLNESGDGYNTYVDVYLGSDGYYHVGSATGPLLLASHLTYTQFDSEKTVSERVYANYELMVDGVNMFNNWLIYGNAASNSEMTSYTPVTEELRKMLVAYCDTYRREEGVAKAASENLWLQLCVYYDAYGVDKDGNPTKHLADPTRGLTAFSAFDVEIKNENPTVQGEIVASGEVTYNRVIMPRGLLYKFVPTKSGVYRITSKSDKEVNGWIFTGSHEEWVENAGSRTILTSDSVAERITEDLIIENEDGTREFDRTNVSIVAYMEAGEAYYIDIAYYDVYETGTFTFDVKWVGESFGYFVQASPGPITYIESIGGGIGQLIAAGIDYEFVMENGVEYAYHVLERDENGNATKLGEKIYADFYYPTTLFPSQSIEELVKANAFNYTVSEKDREALIILDSIRMDGKEAIISKWLDNKTFEDESAAEAHWSSLGLDDAIKDMIDGTVEGSYTDEVLALATEAIREGEYALKAEWGAALITSKAWKKYDMDNAIRGKLSEDEDTKKKQQDYLADVNEEYTAKWAEYQLDDVKVGIFHNTDNRTGRDKQAEKCLEIYKTEGKEALKKYWDSEFKSIVPSEDDKVSDVSEWRFNYFWNIYYQMDDVVAGKYHGNLVNYTPTMLEYIAKMDNVATNPERQGCVAVTRELAEILDTLISREVFENVQGGWLKFCYYYDILGADAE